MPGVMVQIFFLEAPEVAWASNASEISSGIRISGIIITEDAKISGEEGKEDVAL